MKSVTKPISRPFHANSHGHDPLSRWLAGIGGVGGEAELRLQDAVRPGDAGDVGRGRLAEAEVHGRRRDDLLLRVQTGAHFDLAADAERVDALIAGRGCGARTNELPVIRLGAGRTHDTRAFGREPGELEPAVAIQVGGAGDGNGRSASAAPGRRRSTPPARARDCAGPDAIRSRAPLLSTSAARSRAVSSVSPGGGSRRTTSAAASARPIGAATTAARRSRRRRARGRRRDRRPRRPRRRWRAPAAPRPAAPAP